MTNKEKAEEIVQSFRTARMFSKHPCEIAENAAQQMAEWKDDQYENKIRELLNNSFYLHPHYSNTICSDDFECNDSFEDFVEEFIKRIKEIEV